MIATGKLNEVAAKLGDQAPMAATCCNAKPTLSRSDLRRSSVQARGWLASLAGPRQRRRHPTPPRRVRRTQAAPERENRESHLGAAMGR